MTIKLKSLSANAVNKTALAAGFRVVSVYRDLDEEEQPWTDEDEAGLEQYEDDRRRRIAEQNEY